MPRGENQQPRWPADRKERLRVLWLAENEIGTPLYSATQIGRMLGGFSKHAIVGMRQRMKLPKRREPIARRDEHQPARDPFFLPRPPVQVWPKEVEPMIRHATCQWFESDELKDANKCGKPAVRGRSWCAEHTARAVLIKTRNGTRPWRPEDDEREVAA